MASGPITTLAWQPSCERPCPHARLEPAEEGGLGDTVPQVALAAQENNQLHILVFGAIFCPWYGRRSLALLAGLRRFS